MKAVNIYQAKTEEVVIARNGEPVARLTAVQPAIPRELGLWRNNPGWEDYVFDRAVLAPMTDLEMQDEGWM